MAGGDAPRMPLLPPGPVGEGRHRGMRLRLRLILATSVPVLLLMALAGGVVVREFAEVYHDEARSRAAEELRSLSRPCARALAVNALDQLDGFLADAVANERNSLPLLAIAMVDARGGVVAHSGTGALSATEAGRGGAAEAVGITPAFMRRAAAAELPIWRRHRAQDGRLLLDMSMPSVSGLRWGTLVGRFDLGRVAARVAAARNALVGLALLLTATLALALNLALRRLVAEPVHELAKVAGEIRRGALDTRAWVASSDELGELAADFNAMADELQSYTESLERKVEARSAEVRRKNRQLEDVNARLAGAVRELERIATVDKLTQVHNRRFFDEALDFEYRRSERTVHVFCLIMVDVDHFKNYNDRNGHQAGDRALQRLARILRDELRATDLLARYGGEEFVILLYDTDREAGIRVAETLRRAVASRDFEHGAGQPLGRVTASFGLAAHPADGDDAEGLLRCADLALYAAKSAGRDRVVAWSPALDPRPEPRGGG